MTKYDIILTPALQKDAIYKVDGMLFPIKKDVIVLTIEELREMFVDAVECGEDKFETRSIDEMFTQYLTSKGITYE